MFYVQVIGSYDSAVIGPFASVGEAVSFKTKVPANFDGYVLTQSELDANFAEFGKCDIHSPEWFLNS